MGEEVEGVEEEEDGEEGEGEMVGFDRTERIVFSACS